MLCGNFIFIRVFLDHRKCTEIYIYCPQTVVRDIFCFVYTVVSAINVKVTQNIYLHIHAANNGTCDFLHSTFFVLTGVADLDHVGTDPDPQIQDEEFQNIMILLPNPLFIIKFNT